jgi:AcrR family transcriptional regulator
MPPLRASLPATARSHEVGAATADALARRAGVGVGTLYRHFPSRDALVATTYRHEVDQLCDSVDGLLASRAPDDALRAWMDSLRQGAPR